MGTVSDSVKEFDPSRYLTKVGSSDYLEVKWRLVWLRDVHPNAKIKTECIKYVPPGTDPDGEMVGFAAFKCTISTDNGAEADGHGSESVADFREYFEKAETKAIGRALAALGFGTQFSSDHEFSAGSTNNRQKIVDSPVANNQSTNQQQQRPSVGSGGSITPRQRSMLEILIKKEGENPADFADTLSVMNVSTASDWIQKLQAGNQPWLEPVGPKV